MKYLDIDAPIIPGKSIGNINIGDKLSKYLNIIDERIKSKLLIQNIDINENKITFNKLPIEIFVKVDSDEIYKLSAGPGYKGKLNGVISIGDKAKDILKKDHNFYYDDFYESLLNRSQDGVILEFSNDEPWDENTNIEELFIQFITIFNPKEILF
ncbi:hypothetical protein [Acinetobacter haemolyticus]|uniref:hypothetical protein n=1 Tax=Acinetobacter haemolyticus TaxID=29430 RepID=UPI0024DEC924|nr:hypothetical protein [Acinetobacter haemolyticus]